MCPDTAESEIDASRSRVAERPHPSCSVEHELKRNAELRHLQCRDRGLVIAGSSGWLRRSVDRCGLSSTKVS
jgi:hypothetical protein